MNMKYLEARKICTGWRITIEEDIFGLDKEEVENFLEKFKYKKMYEDNRIICAEKKNRRQGYGRKTGSKNRGK